MSKAAELAALIGSQSALSNRNLIINGAMQVAQRGTSGINSAAGGGICVDRFKGFSSGGGVFSMEQSSTVPNNEFAYSSKLTVTTADSSIASADYYSFQQNIEGYNIIQTGYGTSDAKRLVLSFWVRSSVTGKYSVTCFNDGGTEGYLNTFNISSADTWQKVELSWIGRTSGTWLKTNGAGMIIRFDLGGGSSGHGTADQWTTTSGYGNTRTADSVNWIATNGATFYMTGLQLGLGEQATPFEHRRFGDELSSCERYYEKTYEYETAPGTSEAYPTNMGMRINGLDGTSGQRYMVFRLRTEKRARPTNTYYGHSGTSGKISTADAGGSLTERDIALSVTSTSMVGGGSANGTYAGLMLYVVSDAEL